MLYKYLWVQLPAHKSAQLNTDMDLGSLQFWLYYKRVGMRQLPSLALPTQLPALYRQEVVQMEGWASQSSNQPFCIQQSTSLCVDKYKDLKLD